MSWFQIAMAAESGTCTVIMHLAARFRREEVSGRIMRTGASVGKDVLTMAPAGMAQGLLEHVCTLSIQDASASNCQNIFLVLAAS